jgi:hypothetical protein
MYRMIFIFKIVVTCEMKAKADTGMGLTCTDLGAVLSWLVGY